MSPPAIGHRARKRFGQHFLVDPSVVARIVDALHLPRAEPPEGPSRASPATSQRGPQAPLVEIGPGLGALTEPLLARAGTLHAIEIDRDLVARLERRALEGLVLHQRDVLEVDFVAFARELAGASSNASAGAPIDRLRLIGNLPYNVATPLLLNLVRQSEALIDVHAMVQLEVAQRLQAPPGDRHRGRLSVMIGAAFDTELLFEVPPDAFEPAPKVHSAVVRLLPRDDRPTLAVLDALERTTRIAFANRRKTLRNNFRAHLDATALEACDIDPGERAERIDLAGFLRIAERMERDSP